MLGESKSIRAIQFAYFVVFLLVVLALSPHTINAANPIKQLIFAFGMTAIAVVWLFSNDESSERGATQKSFAYILLPILALYLVSAARGGYWGNSFEEIRRLLFLGAAYYVAAEVFRSPASVTWALGGWVVAMACASVYGMFQLAGVDPFPWADRETLDYLQLPASFGHPNYAAHALIPTIIACFYLAANPGTRWFAIFLPLFAAHQYFTAQRGGLVALAAAAAVVVVVAVLRRKNARRELVAGAAAVTIVGFGAAGFLVIRMTTGQFLPVDDAPTVSRYNAYFAASTMVVDKPLLGFGPGNYVIENPNYWTPFEKKWFAEGLIFNDHVHNEILEVAVDAGLPAAGLFGAVFILAIARAFQLAQRSDDPRRRRLGYTFIAFFCALFVDGLFGFNLHVPVSAIMFFVGLGMLEGLSDRRDSPSRPPLFQRSKIAKVLVVPALVAGALLEAQSYVAETGLFRGKGLVYAHAHQQADQALAFATERTPWKWSAGHFRGLARSGLGDHESAIEFFEQSLDANPTWIVAMVPLARSHIALGTIPAGADVRTLDSNRIERHLAEARSLGEHVLELCGVYSQGESVLGRVELTRATNILRTRPPGGAEVDPDVRRLAESAEEHFQKALELGAQDTHETHLLLAQVRLWKGDRPGAIDALSIAAGERTNNDEMWLAFERASAELGQYDRLLKSLKDAITANRTKDRPDRQHLASLYARLARVQNAGFSNVREAAEAYVNAIETVPTRTDIWLEFVDFALTQDAVPYLSKAANRMSDRVPAGNLSMSILATFAQGTPESLAQGVNRFFKSIEEAAFTDSSELEALAALASQFFRSKPELIEEQPVAAMKLGGILVAIEKYAAAHELLAKTYVHLAEADRSTGAQYWAAAAAGLGQPEQSEIILRSALTGAPYDVELRFAHAKALLSIGRYDDAQDAMETLLSLPGLGAGRREIIQSELNRLRKSQ